MWVPVGVWRIAFSIRLSARRCSSSRAPSTDGGSASTLSVVAGDRLELGGRLDEHPAEVGRHARGLAAGVGAGQQQQVGHEPAHAL